MGANLHCYLEEQTVDGWLFLGGIDFSQRRGFFREFIEDRFVRAVPANADPDRWFTTTVRRDTSQILVSSGFLAKYRQYWEDTGPILWFTFIPIVDFLTADVDTYIDAHLDAWLEADRIQAAIAQGYFEVGQGIGKIFKKYHKRDFYKMRLSLWCGGRE